MIPGKERVIQKIQLSCYVNLTVHLFASKFSNFDTPNIEIFEFLYFQTAFFTNLQMFVYLCLATFNIIFVFL